MYSMKSSIKSGSSPRMRGARAILGPRILHPRIIPADAGSTGPLRARHPSRTDHPRGCGEHDEVKPALFDLGGSSPRMRGAPSHTRRCCNTTRIIPADAGSTATSAEPAAGCWDHPRGCGEHTSQSKEAKFGQGSSPRMRGAQGGGMDHVVGSGIIPADAGSTGNLHVVLTAIVDHPRGCGEHDVELDEIIKRMGIIPADAGSTRPGGTRTQIAEDHPRGCGEHLCPSQFRCSSSGSSPRMRGARNLICQENTLLRIIPADAGSTPCHHRCAPAHADHPRGCGEHGAEVGECLLQSGSSPRMRGARVKDTKDHE